jgi:hypothetical protein
MSEKRSELDDGSSMDPERQDIFYIRLMAN